MTEDEGVHILTVVLALSRRARRSCAGNRNERRVGPPLVPSVGLNQSPTRASHRRRCALRDCGGFDARLAGAGLEVKDGIRRLSSGCACCSHRPRSYGADREIGLLRRDDVRSSHRVGRGEARCVLQPFFSARSGMKSRSGQTDEGRAKRIRWRGRRKGIDGANRTRKPR